MRYCFANLALDPMTDSFSFQRQSSVLVEALQKIAEGWKPPENIASYALAKIRGGQMSEQTQEWTEESVAEMFRAGGYGYIAADHNAALAASLADQPAFRKATEANIKFLEELAAQRERYDDLLEALKKILSDGQSREAQIARDALAMMSAE